MNTNEEVSAIIGQCEGSAVSLHVQRDNTETTLTLQPVYDNNDKRYKGGIWVRDSSAGIGTLTFYDPTTQMFGGLGHAVCDVDTGEIMPLSSGEVVSVDITGVKKAPAAFPGN